MAVLDALKLPAAALAGAVIAAGIFKFIVIPAAVQSEADRLTNLTNQAIGDLGNAADQARIGIRLCSRTGGVWDFTAAQCRQGKPAQ